MTDTYTRELRCDVNDIANMYCQLDPVHKAIYMAMMMQITEIQIESRFENDGTIVDDFLYYLVGPSFFKEIDFLERKKYETLVLAIGRDMDSVTVVGYRDSNHMEIVDVTNNVEEVYIALEAVLEELSREGDELYQRYDDSRPIFQTVGLLLMERSESNVS